MATGYQPNVVAGAPIASAWGNTIRDRTVMVFATAAERDAAIPAPSVGMACYVIGTGLGLLIYAGAVVGWRRPWNTEWGIVATGTSILGNTAAAGTTVDANGMTVTFTPVPNRLYQCELQALVSVTIAGAAPTVLITDAANNPLDAVMFASSTVTGHWPIQRRTNPVVPPAGAVTWKMRIQAGAGSNCIFNYQTDVRTLNEIRVRDVGPAGAAT